MRGRLRSVLRVARWEASGVTGGLDRRTVLAALALLAVVGAVVGAGLVAGVAGLDVDRDIYRVGVDPDDPHAAVVADEPALTLVPADGADLGENVDLLVVHSSHDAVVVQATETTKGAAATAEFREAIEAHNERLFAAETNETAAFPVTVTLQYVDRTGGVTAETTLGGDDDADDDAADADAVERDGDDAVERDGDDAVERDGDELDADGDGTGDGDGTEDGSDDADDADDADEGDDADDDRLAVPSVGGGGGAFGADAAGSPGEITPPFPFVALVLAFAFLVPMNFLIQAYGSSVLNERINRRGELLLVSPLGPAEIVAGKTLPYVAAAVAVTAVIALAVGGGVVSVLAVFPLAFTFLAATFVGAMFARSFKELTFVTVAVSVFLTTYAFVPAVFTNVTPVALISPLTLVVLDLQGEAVSLGAFLFSTGPVLIGGALLFVLGLGVYREEDMFTQKPVPRKFLDALAVRLSAVDGGLERGRRRSVLRGLGAVAVLTACTIPFVFVAELLAVAVLFALPVTVSIPVLLVTIAFIEEVAKTLHLYAGFERDVFARTDRVAVAVGLASGFGFFLAEKATAVVQAVGLTELYVGRAAFGAVAGLGALSPLVAVGLFFAPLALHGFATVVAAVGASRSRAYYAVTLALATLLHAAYNVGVVSLHG